MFDHNYYLFSASWVYSGPHSRSTDHDQNAQIPSRKSKAKSITNKGSQREDSPANILPKALYENGHLCVACQGINIEELCGEKGYEHQRAVDVFNAAGFGCEICEGVMGCLFECRARDVLETYEVPAVMRYLSCEGVVRLSVGDTVMGDLEAGLSDGILRIRKYIIPKHPLPLISSSTYYASLISSWMEMPQNSALKPRDNNQPQQLPQRVIDISNPSPLVFLKDFTNTPPEDPSRKGLYITLSHRWSTRETMPLTTTSTLSSRIAAGINISNSSFPTGFRDAIELTRSLGLKYIWIDSFCIIQDDPQDWERESAKMHQYYSNSWLTLALGFPSDEPLFPAPFIPLSDPHHNISIGHTARAFSHSSPSPSSSSSPTSKSSSSILSTRAWTYQEEMLSPLYLLFLPSHRLLFQSGSLPTWYSPPSHFPFRKKHSPDLKNRCTRREWWYLIMHHYSSRELTDRADKLAALSGVAHLHAMVLGGKDAYLAGLWGGGDLVPMLCWFRTLRGRRSRQEGRNEESRLGLGLGVREREREKVYRAPSWSWASIDGEVDFNWGYKGRQCRIDVLRAETNLCGGDQMGRVSAGLLSVRGNLLRGKYKGEDVFPRNVLFQKKNKEKNGETEWSSAGMSYLTLDSEGIEVTVDEEIICVVIAEGSALALRKVEEQDRVGGNAGDTYRRIGYVDMKGADKAVAGSSLQRQVIHII